MASLVIYLILQLCATSARFVQTSLHSKKQPTLLSRLPIKNIKCFGFCLKMHHCIVSFAPPTQFLLSLRCCFPACVLPSALLGHFSTTCSQHDIMREKTVAFLCCLGTESPITLHNHNWAEIGGADLDDSVVAKWISFNVPCLSGFLLLLLFTIYIQVAI